MIFEPIPNPLYLEDYTRAHLIERIMVKHGRNSTDPVNYRRVLWGMGIPALRRALNESTFPAVSLTENAGVIASADKGESPTPRGEPLTLEPTLP